MNIFFLDEDPALAASYLGDQHIIKMILESAQLLSTAHRVLDGQKIGQHYQLMDSRETILYKATHINHPCAIWARQNSANYTWLYNHFTALCDQYKLFFGKIHKTDYQLRKILKQLPKSIGMASQITFPALAMPDKYKSDSFVESYRKYYYYEKVITGKIKYKKIPYPEIFELKN